MGIESIPIGIHLVEGTAHIKVWAPLAKEVICQVINLTYDIPLVREEYGYWYAKCDGIKVGDRYHFLVDGTLQPDPVSRYQPDGVHGDSQVVDLAFDWTDGAYRAPDLSDLIIYELHVGTFSATGDFEGVIRHLSYLKELGINAIELMPVAQFPGTRNWGYDGVFSFAVQHSYGGPGEFQKLVNACHELDIAVILDVVYNHFGPEGNCLSQYGPYFTQKYQTPWGEAVNYDDSWCNGPRDFVLQNVKMWFDEFHIDALRLDAVHAIKDFSTRHILQDIRLLTDAVVQRRGKPHYLIVECDLNDRRYLDPIIQNGFNMDAQWLDEFHHALRVAAGEDKNGYYSDFDGVDSLAKAYKKAYVFDGNFSQHRKKFFGGTADQIPSYRFIVFSQNHDQVGNRMLGERSSMLYNARIQRLLAMAVMISPFTPLLFMGEEWASKSPFFYFVNHSDPELIEAVRKGRQQEFADFQCEGKIPDPQKTETFNRSLLNWHEKDESEHAEMLAFYKTLICFRKNNPIIKNCNREDLEVYSYPDRNSIELRLRNDACTWIVFLNFSAIEQHFEYQNHKTYIKLLDTDNVTGHFPRVNDDIIRIAPQSGAIFELKEGNDPTDTSAVI